MLKERICKKSGCNNRPDKRHPEATFCSESCYQEYRKAKIRVRLEAGDTSFGKRVYKQYLIEKHGYKCWNCGLSEWMGQPIPLEIEHKNGDKRDNRLENLEILCCNCHGLTDTWKGKNMGNPLMKTKVKTPIVRILLRESL